MKKSIRGKKARVRRYGEAPSFVIREIAQGWQALAEERGVDPSAGTVDFLEDVQSVLEQLHPDSRDAFGTSDREGFRSVKSPSPSTGSTFARGRFVAACATVGGGADGVTLAVTLLPHEDEEWFRVRGLQIRVRDVQHREYLRRTGWEGGVMFEALPHGVFELSLGPATRPSTAAGGKDRHSQWDDAASSIPYQTSCVIPYAAAASTGSEPIVGTDIGRAVEWPKRGTVTTLRGEIHWTLDEDPVRHRLRLRCETENAALGGHALGARLIGTTSFEVQVVLAPERERWEGWHLFPDEARKAGPHYDIKMWLIEREQWGTPIRAATASALTSDGNAIAWVTPDSVVVCDVATGSVLRESLIDRPVTCLGVSANGILVWCLAGGDLIIERLDGERRPLQLNPRAQVSCVAVSDDGARVALGSEDGVVRVWDVQRGALVADCRAHSGQVTSVAFGRGGTRVVSGGGDARVIVWEAETAAIVADCRGHLGKVTSVAFSGDGTHVVSAGTDHVLRVFDACSGALWGSWDGSVEPLSVTINADGTLVAVASKGGCLDVLTVEDGRLIRRIAPPDPADEAPL